MSAWEIIALVAVIDLTLINCTSLYLYQQRDKENRELRAELSRLKKGESE